MRSWTGLALVALLSSCVAPREAAPPPRPAPRPVPLPPPAPPAPPPSADWRDWPLSPGNWSYASRPGRTSATFGPAGAPDFSVECTPATQMVTLWRNAPPAAEAALLDITASNGRQSFRAALMPDPPGIAVRLPARDPFLDKMAFSRGRFVVLAGGMPRLVIPAWPEFVRVIEDCRG